MTSQLSDSGSTMPATTRTPAQAAFAKQLVLKDIEITWARFTPEEVARLRNKDDLVAQLVARYGLEKAVAERDVEALLKGRTIQA